MWQSGNTSFGRSRSACEAKVGSAEPAGVIPKVLSEGLKLYVVSPLALGALLITHGRASRILVSKEVAR